MVKGKKENPRILKDQINHLLRRIGYEIRKGPRTISGITVENDFFPKHSWIKKFDFHTILDIGANQGQFAARFRLLFPQAMIYSFEPIPEVFGLLCERFKEDALFKGFNVALGEASGTFDFYQNEFTDSSSFLPMKALHKESFPFTKNEQRISLPVETLDHMAESMPSLKTPLLIKIDVQGFERMVILGGIQTIKKAEVLIVEVSFQELYENQEPFDTIYTLLRGLGFTFIGNYDQLLSPKDGSILQADAIFLNQSIQRAD